MTSDSDQRPFQSPRHVFDKTRFATAGRAFQDAGEVRGVRRCEQIHFVIDGQVIGLVSDSVFFYGAFGHLIWILTSCFGLGLEFYLLDDPIEQLVVLWFVTNLGQMQVDPESV